MLTNTGTYHYKAPEMFEGAGYSEKIDAWAVGVTLYELITGVTPFEAEYCSDTIKNIVDKQPDMKHPAFECFSPLVKDLISRLLKKNPKERLSCAEARHHLWLEGPEISFSKSADISQQLKLISDSMPSNSSDSDSESSEGERGRRNSVVHHNPEQPRRISKQDKYMMKRWLSIVSDREAHDEGGSFKLIPDSEHQEFGESESGSTASPVRSVDLPPAVPMLQMDL